MLDGLPEVQRGLRELVDLKRDLTAAQRRLDLAVSDYEAAGAELMKARTEMNDITLRIAHMGQSIIANAQIELEDAA